LTLSETGLKVASLKAGVLAEPVLVGREMELEELQRCLDSAIEGRGSTVFISGEAGSGKTRLTNEFLKQARKKDVTVFSGWCLSNAAVPYFPFFEAFNTYFSDHPKEEGASSADVAIWLRGPAQGELPGRLSAFSPQAWKDQTFVAVTKTLLEISTRKPVVLLIEDAHWADSASLSLIHYIGRAIKTAKTLLLVTFRSEGLIADAEGRPHPLIETLRLMRREDIVQELKIVNLDETNVSTLARNMLGGELERDFTEKLAKESQGNPLFIVESLRMLHERNRLLQENNKWRLVSEKLAIPDKIRDIILQRMSILLHNQRKIIDAASVIGEKFDAELLASVVGLDFAEVVEALELIGQTTSLLVCEEGLYRFDHARTRDAVYGEISSVLKKVYHGKVAEQLESKSRGKFPLSEVAYHYAQAENKEKAVEYALASGQDALTRWSNVEAIRHFSYVLQAVADAPENVETRRVAWEGLGDAYYANSMFDNAIETFEELAEFATGSLKLRAYRKEMEAVWYKDFNPELLMELVKKAEKYTALDRLETARIRGYRGRAFHTSGDLEKALEDHEEALRVFEEEYSLYDAANLVVGVGFLHVTFSGLLEKGFSEILRGITMLHELGDTLAEVHSYNIALANGFHFTGLYPESLNANDYVIRIGEEIGDFQSVTMAFTRRGLILEELGNPAEAVPEYHKAHEFSQKTDSERMRSEVYLDLVIVYAVLGDLDRAEKYYCKLMEKPHKDMGILMMRGAYVKDVLFFAKGQHNELEQKFEKGIAFFAPLSLVAAKVGARRLYAWYLDKQGRTEEAKVQLAEIQRLMEETAGRFAHANIQASLMAKRRVEVDKELEMRLDLVNVGRKSGLLVEVKNVLFEGFEVSSSPSWCVVQNGNVKMENREIGPFKVETAKFTVKGLKLGTFTLNPQAVYMDDLGNSKAFNVPPITVTVNPPTPREKVAGKIYSGTLILDQLLLGGLPENYAVVLAAPSSDVRSQLIKCFLETGLEEGETTFHVTTEATIAKALARENPSNFYLIVCNPQADTMFQNAPTVFKLKGVENLTDIDIALNKAFRSLKPSTTDPRRICIDVVSDVLLQNHAINTRRWLSALLPTLKSKGFTTLAVVDPSMHPAEELQAILGVFDGEIRVTEKETPEGTKHVLKIRKLINQKYLDNEIIVSKEKLAL
jgi:tetratricopeptide (TPR) repeat protein/KaiC/GvpD/RAD55 family RecA-like ATPase